MIVSQSLYCSEFVHRASCSVLPRRLASDRAADRKDARARAQRRKHMGSVSRSVKTSAVGGGHAGPDRAKTGWRMPDVQRARADSDCGRRAHNT